MPPEESVTVVEHQLEMLGPMDQHVHLNVMNNDKTIEKNSIMTIGHPTARPSARPRHIVWTIPPYDHRLLLWAYNRSKKNLTESVNRLTNRHPIDRLSLESLCNGIDVGPRAGSAT